MTPKEVELLQMLAEECFEVIQAAMKTLRHGLESYHPEDRKQTPNWMLIEKELMDVLTTMRELRRQGVLS